MINLSFFADLAALPFKFLSLPQISPHPERRVRHLETVWNITGEVLDAMRPLALLYSASRTVARDKAKQIIEKSRDFGHLAYIGRLDIEATGSVDWAQLQLEHFELKQFANEPMLNYLRLLIAQKTSSLRAIEYADRILSRKDFPPDITYAALKARSGWLVSEKRFKELEAIIPRMAALRENVWTISLRMAVQYSRGEEDVSDITKKLISHNPDEQFYCQSIAWGLLGNSEKAREAFQRCSAEFRKHFGHNPNFDGGNL